MRTPPPPHTLPPAPKARSRPLRMLTVLTLGVLLVHWVLLSGTPLVMASHPALDAGSVLTFTTRTLPKPAPKPPAPPEKKPVKKAAPRPAPTPPTTPPSPVVPVAPTAADSIAPTVLADTSGSPTAPTEDPSASAEEPQQAAPPEPPSTPATGPTQEITQYTYPAPVRLKYRAKGEIKGIPYFANGELLWNHNSETYTARLEISHFLMGSRVQTSVGALSPRGLEPTRFGDKVRSEVAAHFDRTLGKVTFSANTPDVPLLAGAQDQVSVFIQMASMLRSAPDLVPTGITVPFQAVGPRSAESWAFVVGSVENLNLPGGDIAALRLWRDPTGEHDPKVEIWLAPTLEYMPVRIRLTRGSDDFVELQWNSTEKPLPPSP